MNLVKIAGSKIVYSVAFLYTNNKRSESEGNNPIYHHIKANKISRNKPKEAKDSENS